MTSNINRMPSGTPEGGRFTGMNHRESPVALGTPARDDSGNEKGNPIPAKAAKGMTPRQVQFRSLLPDDNEGLMVEQMSAVAQSAVTSLGQFASGITPATYAASMVQLPAAAVAAMRWVGRNPNLHFITKRVRIPAVLNTPIPIKEILDGKGREVFEANKELQQPLYPNVPPALASTIADSWDWAHREQQKSEDKQTRREWKRIKAKLEWLAESRDIVADAQRVWDDCNRRGLIHEQSVALSPSMLPVKVFSPEGEGVRNAHLQSKRVFRDISRAARKLNPEPLEDPVFPD